MHLAAVADAPGGTRSIGAANVFASAPSVKGATGLFAMHADADGAGSCLVFGNVTLEG